jgi:protein MpaA
MTPQTPKIYGQSHNSLPIEVYTFGSGSTSVLFIGGVHGDEVEGFTCVENFLALLQTGKYVLPSSLTLHVCPRLNPDGCAANRRTNARNVDLNRNLPTQNWSGDFKNVRYYPGAAAGSEPENKVLVEMLSNLKPKLIVSLHSYEHAMTNYDGEISRAVAEQMSKVNGLAAKGDIGYPTTGSLGNYAAMERKIPTVTLEILKDQNLNEAWTQHRPGLEAALEWASHHDFKVSESIV